MAKFCTKCGKALEEGKKHVCDNVEEVEEKVVNNSKTNDYVNSYLDMVKKVLTKPVDMIKEYTNEENFNLSIIALILNCAVTGIFVYLILKEAMNGLGMLSSVIGLGSFGLGNIEIPFMKIFMGGLLFMAVWFVVCALMIFLIANVFMKDKITFKESIVLVGNTSVFTTITTVISIVLVYISVKLMAFVYIVAAVFYLTYLYQGISDKTELDKNKISYVFVPSVLVAIFVVVYVLPRILV